jgi:hypothetical protein
MEKTHEINETCKKARNYDIVAGTFYDENRE